MQKAFYKGFQNNKAKISHIEEYCREYIDHNPTSIISESKSTKLLEIKTPKENKYRLYRINDGKINGFGFKSTFE